MRSLIERAPRARSWIALSALALALSSLAGCGDPDGGGTTTTSGTGGSTAGTGGSTGGSTATSGTGGSTGTSGTGGSTGTTTTSDPPPELGATKVGSPLWEPVDYHQFAAEVGSQFENFHAVAASLLPPPNHQDHPALGVGPGDPHAGPYDGELAAGVLAEGYVEHSIYPQADGLLPNAIFGVFMVVPSAGAPTGSSPDSASGPIIPNTVFPIHVAVDAYFNNTLLDGYSYEFDVPPLDATLDPPFDVDGHSHFPMFDAGAFDGLPETFGTLETRMAMTDANGDGWNLVLTYTAVP